MHINYCFKRAQSEVIVEETQFKKSTGQSKILT